MMLDISLTPQSVIVLFPLIAVLAFLLVFVGPWIYSKVSAPFFGGAQMDRRGPGPSGRLQSQYNNRQTKYGDHRHGHGHSSSYGGSGYGSSGYGSSTYGSSSGYGGSYGNGYRSNYGTNNRNSDYDQFFYRDSEPTYQEFAADDSDDDDEGDDDDDDDD